MIVGIGTDIVEVARIAEMRERNGDRLAKRILGPSEWERYQSTSNPVAFLARRFAAKEAAAKALGSGMGEGVSWQHIEVGNDALGAPLLFLTGEAQQRAARMGATRWHVSLSDELNYAVAFVVLERDVQS